MIPAWVIALLAILGAVCLALPLHIGMTGVCLLLLAAVLLALRIEEKGRAADLEPGSDRPDRRFDGGDLRRDGVYRRAGAGQCDDAGTDAGIDCRARRAGAGRRAVADVEKAAG